jgi:hypothetical protein
MGPSMIVKLFLCFFFSKKLTPHMSTRQKTIQETSSRSFQHFRLNWCFCLERKCLNVEHRNHKRVKKVEELAIHPPPHKWLATYAKTVRINCSRRTNSWRIKQKLTISRPWQFAKNCFVILVGVKVWKCRYFVNQQPLCNLNKNFELFYSAFRMLNFFYNNEVILQKLKYLQ